MVFSAIPLEPAFMLLGAVALLAVAAYNSSVKVTQVLPVVSTLVTAATKALGGGEDDDSDDDDGGDAPSQ